MSNEASMDEFWHAVATNDSDIIFRYIAATLFAIGIIWIVCCSCFCACNSLMFSLKNTCCLFRNLFYALRWIGRSIFCCGWLYKQKHDGSNECFSLSKNDDQCSLTRSTQRNAANRVVTVPFCAAHWKDERRRVAIEVSEFEQKGAKYTPNLRWRASKSDVCHDIKSEIKQARKRGPKPGFVYIFTSSRDQALVPKSGGDSQIYFYKIGMTTQATAKERVKEWPDSVFENKEGRGYWEVKGNALSAEQLIHTLLVNDRFTRFNPETDQFETEWFHVSYERAASAIKLVVDDGPDYTSLQNRCEEFAK